MLRFELPLNSDEIWPDFVRRPAPRLRLVLIDDHLIVREGIGALLSLESDLFVAGDAGTIELGIELVRRHRPDLVICDLSMPGYTGGMAVRELLEHCAGAKVLVLTAHDSLESMREAFAAGAVGYVRKDALRVDLLAAVRQAGRGSPAVCSGVGNQVARSWMREAEAPGASAPEDPADRQILRLIALGVPTWRIAADLQRGVKAVEKHRANLMRRLKLGNTAAVARFAVRCNLLSREEVDQLVSAD